MRGISWGAGRKHSVNRLYGKEDKLGFISPAVIYVHFLCGQEMNQRNRKRKNYRVLSLDSISTSRFYGDRDEKGSRTNIK